MVSDELGLILGDEISSDQTSRGVPTEKELFEKAFYLENHKLGLAMWSVPRIYKYARSAFQPLWRQFKKVETQLCVDLILIAL